MQHTAVSIFVLGNRSKRMMFTEQNNLQLNSLKHSEMLQAKSTYLSETGYVQENKCVCGVCMDLTCLLGVSIQAGYWM